MALNKKPYKGCRDFLPKDMKVRDYLFSHMKEAAQAFGFEAYDGPILEEVELYKAKSGEELINDQIYSFTDRGERFVAIRPEMTPTLARMVARVHRELPKPLRWYSIPNLMRYEAPQRGRLREHWQFNVDIFGAEANLGEIEIFSVIVHFLKGFGADNSMFEILVNDRKIVDSVFNDLLSLDEDSSYKLYKVIDKAKKVTTEKLDTMISEIITDEAKKSLFKSYLKLSSFEEVTSFLAEHSLTEKCVDFISLHKKLKNLSTFEYLTYDPTIVRGLDYYTGVVFEIFDKHPDNKRAIAGGGAYANLLKIFNEEPLPGIGFGLGDVTLKDFLETHNLLPDLSASEADLFITYFDDECENTAFKIATQLREEGLKVELNLGAIKFKKVFKLAESKGHSFVALLGENELKAGEIQIKNLKTRDGKNIKLDDIQAIKKFIKDR